MGGGLPARAARTGAATMFFDPATFPFTRHLEHHWQAIALEFESIRPDLVEQFVLLGGYFICGLSHTHATISVGVLCGCYKIV